MRKRSITAIDMPRESTACFTGHRPEKLPWGYNEANMRCFVLKAELSKMILQAYGCGYTHFIAGGALGADMYAAEAVLELKRTHTDITLELALPFPTFNMNLRGELRERFDAIVLRADKATVCAESYTPYSYMRRKAYMVDSSGLLIAIYDHRPGGTKNTVEYARKKGRGIWLLHP